MTLTGKVAIVTGTSPNIGGGIALGLADAGARVVAVDIEPDHARRCADAIVKRGGQAIGVACDVTSEPDVEAAVSRGRATRSAAWTSS